MQKFLRVRAALFTDAGKFFRVAKPLNNSIGSSHFSEYQRNCKKNKAKLRATERLFLYFIKKLKVKANITGVIAALF